MEQSNQYSEKSKQYKKKVRSAPVNPKPETVVKLNVAKRMLADGKHISEITKAIEYKSHHTTLTLLRQYDVPVPREQCGFGEDPDDEWFKGTADASDLTAYELECCVRLDIKPERWAWLKTCPKGGITKFDYKDYRG
jgi:hypothetical protein